MTSVSLLGRLETDAAALRLRVEVLTRQTSTGRKTDQLGDLAPQLPRALTLSAEIQRRDTYGTAIGDALTRASTMQTTLQQLASIAQTFADDVAVKLDAKDTSTLSSVATQARAALVQVGQLLNTQSGGEYIFGGSDFANPPIPDPEGLPSSGMVTRIPAAVAALSPAQAAAQADFQSFADTIRQGLKSAENALADEQGALGLTEERLQSAKDRHATVTDTLTAQVADIEEVDLAATLTRLQATQTALQASYSAIGRLGSLSLVAYLQ